MTKAELNEMISKLYDAMELAGLDGSTLADASEEVHSWNADDGVREPEDDGAIAYANWQQAGGL